MSKSKYFLGAVVGGMLGAAIGMLLAPRSGEETRDMLKEAMNKGCSETKKRIDHEWLDKTEILKSKADNISERVRQLSDEIETRGHALVDKVAGAVKSSANSVKKSSEDEQI